MNLTERQSQVVSVLVERARKGRPAPTYREIAQVLRVDVRCAYQHVLALEKLGVVQRGGGRRGVTLSSEFAPPIGVPVVGQIAAGLPILAEQNISDYVDLGNLAAADDVFLLKVRGDSMVDKRIFDGDFVLVQPQLHLEPGEIGAVAVNGDATVKEVHAMRGRIVLVSHNLEKKYPDQVYGAGDDVRIIGKVIVAFRFIS